MTPASTLTWRCPTCGAIQEETGQCWVCKTPTAACGSCRHLRRSVIGRLSYCGIDKRRRIVAESEVRECWTAPVPLQSSAQLERGVDGTLPERPRLTWVSGGLWEGLEA